jgi:hypothetical protein
MVTDRTGDSVTLDVGRVEVLRRSRGSTAFSFVIPAKAERAYLPQTLGRLSAARRTWDLDFDIIVVLTDRAEASLCSDADTVLCEVDDPGTRSIARARNIGASQSGARLVMHTDADVHVPDLPGFLTRVHAEFADPRLSALTARIEPRPDESTRLDRVMHRVGNAVIRASHRVGPYFGRGECQVVRAADFWRASGYDEAVVVGEDWDLFKRLTRGGRVAFLDDLCVLHSTRRFRRYGYFKTFGIYLREACALTLLKRSWLTEWEPVR